MDFSGKKVFLAPMAGITDPVFRLLCREHGADAVMSEMVSAEGIAHASKATGRMLRFEEKERPIGIQLFGCRPDRMALAARYVQEQARPDFIDINAGCPVPKVVRKNGGASLLRDIGLFSSIVSGMVASVSVPVTVKIRSGWSEHAWVDVEFARAAQDAGVHAVIVHPRSKTMGFSGHSYWERIAIVKKAVSIPVIGNGDIVSAADAKAMFAETGCDSIMIGRGALGNPWIFSSIKAALQSLPDAPPTPSQRILVAREHVRRYREAYGEKKAASDLKKHVSWYVKGMHGSSKIRGSIFQTKSTKDLEAMLESLIPA
jgi:tRNA-dihydrouridine synthase B